MAGSVLTISKGAMFQATDALLAAPPPGKTLAQWYQQLRQDLLTGQTSLAGLATGVGVLGSPADVAHVEQEALGDGPNAFWPQIPDKEGILREGFLLAYHLALAKEPTRPIVTFWSVVAQQNVFEVVVTASAHQITWYWVTTAPANWGRCTGLVEEDMWLVATPQRIDTLRRRFTGPVKPTVSAAGADEHPPRRPNGVHVLRLRGD